MSKVKVYTVSSINKYIKNILSNDYLLKNICIKGEISNCKYHSMGHIYFSIKDENGSMSCLMFKKDVLTGLDFRLEDGQSVIIKGNIDVYERDGKYQLYANQILLDGVGNLFVLYEQLKEKLFNEGLFEFDTKKKICKFPKNIGIVTASTGAAIQDIMNIARRRNPYVQLILYPAKVQGEGAGKTIAKGIETLDKMGLDTIIIGRGGGSMEDLWAFNEEVVARAIFAAKTPIISGTGHETDNTIADYVADLRAPTPSAAAELAIPDVMTNVRRLKDFENSINRCISNKYREAVLKLNSLALRLEKDSPENLLRENQQRLTNLYDRIDMAINRKYDNANHYLELMIMRLHGLSPTAKLINGFGYISASDEPVNSAKTIKKDDDIVVTVHDGEISAKVTDVKKNII